MTSYASMWVRYLVHTRVQNRSEDSVVYCHPLKRKGYEEKSERIAQLRNILNGVLGTFFIPEMDWNILYAGVHNEAFHDLEDSYQYEVACQSACQYLITDNLSDYKNANQDTISIVSPQDFLTRYQ